ncbi:MAG: orotidine-5'-phosphate decarboxylase [Beijerinckiaceae bacterium]|nr:orotidine-5'-phosphate decarboxylase [Beijerinckiaceae bacterium]
MTDLSSPRDRMIVALDLPDVEVALAMVRTLGDAASFYKIGMELTYAGGLPLVRRLADEGKQVFLDLKLHDIPHTVEMATARLAHLGATYLTVHAYPQTLAAAHRGREGSPLRILGVTILTSMTEADVTEAGYRGSVAELVSLRARQAETARIDGIVCSAADITALRGDVSAGFEIVTPGIRPGGSAIGDQKRVMTPAEAIRAGANRLVIGRPIIAAEDPRGMAQRIVEEIANA